MQNKIKLIVGLGNPGVEYSDTRHNAGQWFLEYLAEHYQQNLQVETRFYGAIGRIHTPIGDTRLLVPHTFMNRSGNAVASLANFYRITPPEILVIHDELALPPGSIRLKFDGSSAGHNGLKDIINKLGNQTNFYRLRIGIGHPGQRDKVIGFVLNKPTQIEHDLIRVAIAQGMTQIPQLLSGEMALVMNNLNGFQAKK